MVYSFFTTTSTRQFFPDGAKLNTHTPYMYYKYN